jgi:hypothetical protein
VLGGFLIAALWVALAIAGVRAAEPGRRERRVDASARPPGAAGFRLAPLAPAAMAAVAISFALVLRPDAVASFATEHKPFVLSAFVIAAMAWSLASGLAVVLRR